MYTYVYHISINRAPLSTHSCCTHISLITIVHLSVQYPLYREILIHRANSPIYYVPYNNIQLLYKHTTHKIQIYNCVYIALCYKTYAVYTSHYQCSYICVLLYCSCLLITTTYNYIYTMESMGYNLFAIPSYLLLFVGHRSSLILCILNT